MDANQTKRTVLQLKRKRNEEQPQTIILERPSKAPKGKRKQDLSEVLKTTLSLNDNLQTPTTQKVFRFLASADEAGENFVFNEPKLHELLKKRQESLFKAPQMETAKRINTQQNTAKAARATQINQIRSLSYLHPSFPLIELCNETPAPSRFDLQLPVIRSQPKTQIFDEAAEEYVTYYYVEETVTSDIQLDKAFVVQVESFGDADGEYDEDERYDSDTPSDIDYPEELSTSDEELADDWYNDEAPEMDEVNDDYGSEDSYSFENR